MLHRAPHGPPPGSPMGKNGIFLPGPSARYRRASGRFPLPPLQCLREDRLSLHRRDVVRERAEVGLHACVQPEALYCGSGARGPPTCVPVCHTALRRYIVSPNAVSSGKRRPSIDNEGSGLSGCSRAYLPSSRKNMGGGGGCTTVRIRQFHSSRHYR